jgi:DNA-binding NarL/FixJ family response regulator
LLQAIRLGRLDEERVVRVMGRQSLFRDRTRPALRMFVGGSKLSTKRNSGNRRPDPIRIGLVTDEPIRLAGLASIFDQSADEKHAQLLPVTRSLQELLSSESLKYLVVDLHSYASGLKSLDAIRRARPDIRSIVIGPAGDDDIVLKSIIAGARAYLALHEGPEMVRRAIEVVIEGSIWAPRRLLSKLIDRLLKASDLSSTSTMPQLTAREHQVLELILTAQSNREIAARLGIEERTVRAHLARLMRKAGVDNRIKLSMSARKLFQQPHRLDAQIDAEKRGRRPITN